MPPAPDGRLHHSLGFASGRCRNPSVRTFGSGDRSATPRRFGIRVRFDACTRARNTRLKMGQRRSAVSLSSRWRDRAAPAQRAHNNRNGRAMCRPRRRRHCRFDTRPRKSGHRGRFHPGSGRSRTGRFRAPWARVGRLASRACTRAGRARRVPRLPGPTTTSICCSIASTAACRPGEDEQFPVHPRHLAMLDAGRERQRTAGSGRTADRDHSAAPSTGAGSRARAFR